MPLWAGLVFLILSSISAASPQPTAPPAGKILVDSEDDAMIGEMVRLGASRLEDYDSFELWLVPEKQIDSLRGLVDVVASETFDVIYLREGQTINPAIGIQAPAENLRQNLTKGFQFWIVQFIGPIKEEWPDELKAMGLDIVTYMPNNAYVVWGDDSALVALQASIAKSPVIQWAGPYHPAYRLAPALQKISAVRPAEEWVDVTVQFYSTPGLAASLDRLTAMAGQIYRPPENVLHLTNISLQVPAASLSGIASWDDVFNVEYYVKFSMSDEVQNQIVAGSVTVSGPNVVPTGPGYLSWLATKGFPTTPSSYPVVDIVDDGIDIGNANNVLHPDFHQFGSLSNPDRVAYINNCTADSSGNGVGGHGNLNAGIVASYNNSTGWPYTDGSGYRIGLGVSPYSRIAGTKVFNNSGYWDDSRCGGTDEGVVAASYNAGATMTSNSWGAAVYGTYDASAQAYDMLTRDASGSTPGNQQMLHVFVAGNHGPTSGSIDSPGTAKNVLSVGATENVRDNGTLDGCNIQDANSADDIISFSSRGNTDDDRAKPDIMAPGTHVQGPASQDPGFNGSGVCGASGNDGKYPPTDAYYPSGQTLYTWSSGTSHSTPAVAGAASLLYEYYDRVIKAGQTPSPAMLKALLLNSARYLTGVSANDTLPSPNQGWGDVNLGRLFDGAPNQVIDQSILLNKTGQVYEFTGAVSNTGKPFRVSLVWTDAPGNTTGAAYVNDLDLEVIVEGNSYYGNVFSGQYSITGGSFDPRNNVENVFLPSGTSGSFTVRVIARNIAGDGVPGNSDSTDQDFALVVYNAALAPLLEPAGEVWRDVSANPNGVVDPGDTIQLDVDIRNAGKAGALDVSGVVSPTTNLVTMTTGIASYPNIAVNTTETNNTPYVFEIDPDTSCGADLTFQQTVTASGGVEMTHSFIVPVGLRVQGPVRNIAYAGPPIPIPDYQSGAPGVATATVEITQTGWVNDLDVHFDATHTWDGDLGIDLVSPQGTSVSLYYRSGSNGQNFSGTIFDDSAAQSITSGVAPFTGRFRPRELLSKVNGEFVNGTWSLKVMDYASADTGQITGFSLDFQAVEARCDLVPMFYFPTIFRNANY